MNDRLPVVNFVVPTFFDMDGNNMFFGGAERYLIELVRLVRGLGYETNIYQCANSNWVRYYLDVRVTGLMAQNSEELNKVFHLNFEPGILTIYFAFFLASPYFHQPSIGISHGIYWDEGIFQHFPYGRKARREILSSISHLSTLVSVDTNTINWLRTVYLELAARSIYVPNFVDLKQFHLTSRLGEKDDSKLVVLYPRRLNQVRGFWLMNRLVPSILDQYHKVDFHFVGRADMREEHAIRQLVQRFPERVQWYFLPPEKMHEAYQRADIVVIPTVESEGTSLSCLEAMASGKTVITSNVGGLPNLIIPDYNGLLIEPNEAALRDALTRLIESPDLRARLARSAADVAQAFDIEKWRSRWQSILKKYIPPRQPINQEPITTVFYPAQNKLWASSGGHYLHTLAGQLAESGVDVFWVQSVKASSGHEKIHLLTDTDDLYLLHPWLFFDGEIQPSVLDRHAGPVTIFSYVSNTFPTILIKSYRENSVHFFISDSKDFNSHNQNVKYIPDAMSLFNLIRK